MDNRKRKVSKKVIFLFVLIAIAVAFSIFIVPWDRKPIENQEQAIEIAKEHVLKKYGKNFEDEYAIYVKKEGRNWLVYYLKGEEPNLDGSGGPTLRIRQSDGKITVSYIQE